MNGNYQNELNDYLSGKYTYRRNEKSCQPEDVQKELITVSVSKSYPKLPLFLN